MNELITISVFLGTFIVSFVLLSTSREWDNAGKIITCIVSGAFVLICSVGFAITRLDSLANISQVEATRVTYANMRQDERHLESVSTYADIAKANRWIAKAKAYRAMGWTFMYPSELDDVELIR